MGVYWRLLNLDSRRCINHYKFEGGPMTGLHNLLVRKSTSQLNTLEVMRALCVNYAPKPMERKEDTPAAEPDAFER